MAANQMVASFMARPLLPHAVSSGWHLHSSCVMPAGTLNGYKRSRPYSNAPTRACWAPDNHGVMVRVLTAGDATRLGIACGLDGIARRLDPGPPTQTPYDGAAPLPRSLMQAVQALRDDDCLAAASGGFFARLKQAEIDRFLAEVSPWEHNEYFELL